MDVVATPDVEMRAVKACVLIFFLDMASAMVLNSRQTARTTAHTMKVLETLQVPSALRCGRKGGGDGVGSGRNGVGEGNGGRAGGGRGGGRKAGGRPLLGGSLGS
eukprot:COSAG04_NODE_15508_length_530_cov_0.709977_1_plen_104_part_10